VREEGVLRGVLAQDAAQESEGHVKAAVVCGGVGVRSEGVVK
jgi:hypothetical protein